MEEMPADFRDTTIVTLFKNKGSRADCGNHRDISLLSTSGKIQARIYAKQSDSFSCREESTWVAVWISP